MPQTPEELPRVLDVQRYAEARSEEIRILTGVLQSPDCELPFGKPAVPRQLRRRTRSHNRYQHRQRPNIKLGNTAQVSGRPCNRAQRRRRGLLKSTIHQSCCAPSLPGSNGLRRLETHVWSAKRFKMVTRWNHVLPDHPVGKGHGMRSLLHTAKTGCLVHDASYWVPWELSGSLQQLQALMAAVSDPGLVRQLWTQPSFLAGHHEAATVLYRRNSFPLEGVGPALMMLLADGGSEPAHLVLWLHAAASAAAAEELQQACAQHHVACECRADRWRRLELHGSQAFKCLRAALMASASRPAASMLTQQPPAAQHVDSDHHQQQQEEQQQQQQQQQSSAEPMQVDQQQSAEPADLVQVGQPAPAQPLPVDQLQQQKPAEPAKPAELMQVDQQQQPHPAQPLPLEQQQQQLQPADPAESAEFAESAELVRVDQLQQQCRPLAPNIHRTGLHTVLDPRLRGLGVLGSMHGSTDAQPHWPVDAAPGVPKTVACLRGTCLPSISDEGAGQLRRAGCQAALALDPWSPESVDPYVQGQAAAFCQILTVPATRKAAAAEHRCSLILPANWVMPVWLALIFKGARTTGLQELACLQLSAERPVLPLAQADCRAAVETQAALQTAVDQKLSKRPAGKRVDDKAQLGSWWQLQDQQQPHHAPHFALAVPTGSHVVNTHAALLEAFASQGPAQALEGSQTWEGSQHPDRQEGSVDHADTDMPAAAPPAEGGAQELQAGRAYAAVTVRVLGRGKARRGAIILVKGAVRPSSAEDCESGSGSVEASFSLSVKSGQRASALLSRPASGIACRSCMPQSTRESSTRVQRASRQTTTSISAPRLSTEEGASAGAATQPSDEAGERAEQPACSILQPGCVLGFVTSGWQPGMPDTCPAQGVIEVQAFSGKQEAAAADIWVWDYRSGILHAAEARTLPM